MPKKGKEKKESGGGGGAAASSVKSSVDELPQVWLPDQVRR